MSEVFAVTQTQILAAADELWRSQIIRADAEPTAVMLAIANMLKAAHKHRPRTEAQASDLDPALKRRIIGIG